jgi:hypothetical protein
VIEEDYRYVSCGGDPFTFIKSAIKAMKLQLDPGQEGKIIVMSDKFPYSKEIFESLSRQNSMDLRDMKVEGEELSLYFLRMQD